MPPQDTVGAAASVKRLTQSYQHTAATPRQVRCADLLPPAPQDTFDTKMKRDASPAEVPDVHHRATSGPHDRHHPDKTKPNANGHLWSHRVLAVPALSLSLVYQRGADTFRLP